MGIPPVKRARVQVQTSTSSADRDVIAANERLYRREEHEALGPSTKELSARGVTSVPFAFQRALLGFALTGARPPAPTSAHQYPRAPTSTHERTTHVLPWSWIVGPKSILCCDDMGLGKTFQVLSLVRMQPAPAQFYMDAARAKRYRGNTLVIVLKVTMEQWIAEYARHLRPLCDAHVAVLFHGKAARKTTIAQLCACELVVTTYDCIRAMADGHEGCSLLSVQWWRVVLDEAHVIKNPLSRKFAVIDQLECSRRVALSGTPVHNDVADLFPLLRFLRIPGFGKDGNAARESANAYWRERFATRLGMDVAGHAPVHAAEAAAARIEALAELRALLEPVVIRRMKNSTWAGRPILPGLPRKRIEMVHVDFRPAEDEMYASIEESCLRKASETLLRAGDRVKGCESAAFGKLHALRLCCSVPMLCVDPSGRALYDDCTCGVCSCERVSLYPCGCTLCIDCAESVEDICPVCQKRLDHDRGVPVEASVTHADEAPSSKLQKLFQILCDTPEGEKTIVFSSWLMVLDSIERHLMKGPFSNFARVDGTVTSLERARQLATFRSDPACRVILMTLGAGGTGIDLREANRVILMDPHWNPAVEAQACDRAYRIGQTKDVLITMLVQRRPKGLVSTIEQIIKHVQRSKQASADALFPKPPAREIVQYMLRGGSAPPPPPPPPHPEPRR